MLPVYFIQEVSISILCWVTSGVLLAVGRALVQYLKRGKRHERNR